MKTGVKLSVICAAQELGVSWGGGGGGGGGESGAVGAIAPLAFISPNGGGLGTYL